MRFFLLFHTSAQMWKNNENECGKMNLPKFSTNKLGVDNYLIDIDRLRFRAVLHRVYAPFRKP